MGVHTLRSWFLITRGWIDGLGLVGGLPVVSTGSVQKSAFMDLLIRAVQRDSGALAELASERALTTANISHVLLGLAGDPISFEVAYGCRPEDFFRQVGIVHADLKKVTIHERLRGFFGYLRFTMLALRIAARSAGQEDPAGATREMQDLLADSQVREVFHALYKRTSGIRTARSTGARSSGLSSSTLGGTTSSRGRQVSRRTRRRVLSLLR